MDLDFLQDRRVVYAAAGGALALLAGLGIGLGLMARGHDHQQAVPDDMPASSAGPTSLQVEMSQGDPGLDPAKPLRCFVGGQFVGVVTLAECAKQNGIASGSLDVGLDPSGAIAAANPGASVLQPLPTAPEPPPPVAVADNSASAAPAVAPTPTAAATTGGSVQACWRFADSWRRLPEDMTLDGCVQALFAGKCERPGSADYGRWGGDTLRLVTGRVERSPDNKSFRSLVKQTPGDCSLPHVSN